MTTKVYKTPPVTPEAHLSQLADLKEANEDELSGIQRAVRTSLLSRTSLRAMRTAQIEEMVIAGFSNEQIKIAFAHPDSNLLPLLEGFTGDKPYRFDVEIKESRAKIDNMGKAQHRELYIRSRARLLNACWGFLGKAEPSQSKSLLELMDKLMQDVAESSGVLKQRAGRRARPTTRRGGRDIVPDDTDTKTKDEDSTTVDPDWGGEYDTDDNDPANQIPPKE